MYKYCQRNISPPFIIFIFCRRKEKNENKKGILEEKREALEKKSIKIFNNTDDESINCVESVKLSDSIDSNISTEDIQCLEPVSINKDTFENVPNSDKTYYNISSIIQTRINIESKNTRCLKIVALWTYLFF